MSAIRIQGLDHVVLRVRDLEAALDFYCGALGCREERRIEALGGGDLSVVIERHIQILADQHALVAQVEVTHSDDGHGNSPVMERDRPGWTATVYCPGRCALMQTWAWFGRDVRYEGSNIDDPAGAGVKRSVSVMDRVRANPAMHASEVDVRRLSTCCLTP